jgi:DNA-binding beta-propeller fold protein YncE
MQNLHRAARIAAISIGLGATAPIAAQIAVSANDNKAVLENGVVKVVPNPRPDTISVISLATRPPVMIGEIEAPASVVGPPVSVAIAPDESIALVTSAMKISPADPTKQVPDNRMSVIDLTARPPKVLAVVEAGLGAAGVSINRAGNLALVADRSAGTVSVFTIAGKTVTPAGKVDLGAPASGPSHVAISADGRTALVTRDNDHKISVLAIDGTNVTYTKRDINAGLRPYGLDICAPGNIAVVANIGVGQGDNDTISVIDLTLKPPRVIETVTVGQTPEGIKCSPDGTYVAVVVMNGSNKPADSPFHNANGKVVLYQVNGKMLQKFAEAPIGSWSQGVAFGGGQLLVQNMVQREIQVFQIGTNGLFDTGHRIKVSGGPAGIRTAER